MPLRPRAPFLRDPPLSHLILRPSQPLPIRPADLDRSQIDPVDRARIHRQAPARPLGHRVRAVAVVLLGEPVRDGHAARGAEGVPGYFAPEAVGGEVGFAAERDGGFGRVDPEVGVLCVGVLRWGERELELGW